MPLNKFCFLIFVFYLNKYSTLKASTFSSFYYLEFFISEVIFLGNAKKMVFDCLSAGF
jgi:hypothetical protein